MPVKEKYEDVFVALSIYFIEKTCGITAKEFIEFMYADKNLPENKVAQLDFLAEVVNYLERVYRRWDGDIKRWFYRRKRKLGNLSPYEIMLRPGGWTPQDIIIQNILSIAKHWRR